MTIKEWRKLIDYTENLIATDARFSKMDKEKVNVSVELNDRLAGTLPDDIDVKPFRTRKGVAQVKLVMW